MSDSRDSLFALIQSLSPSEKRHFSLFAARHTIGTENNSVRMFRKLAALKVYDEKKFVADNRKEEFVKHFGFNKHFLYKLILRSLHVFHNAESIEVELREQLHYIDILAGKGLIAQARSILQSALEKADEYDLHALGLELLQREMVLTREEAYAGKSEQDIQEYVRAFKKRAEKLSTRAELEGLTARLSLQANTGGLVRNKKTFDDIKKLENHKALQKEPDDFIGRWHFHSARVALHFLTMNHEEALRHNETLLEALEKKPKVLSEHPRYYLMALNNQMVLLSNFRRYDKMLETAEKIDRIPVRSQVLRNRKFNVSNGLLLQMYTKTGRFQEGLQLIKEAGKKLTQKEVQFLDLQFEIAFYFAAANLYFGVGNFTESNKYLGYIIDRRDLILRSDILCFSLIMRMIVQYEMQKQDLLEYTVRSAYRFLYKRDRLYKFEGILLDFIRKKSPHLETPKKITSAFAELHRQLSQLNKDPYEKNAFAYFDILSWLDSKINGKSFQETVQQNAEKWYFKSTH